MNILILEDNQKQRKNLEKNLHIAFPEGDIDSFESIEEAFSSFEIKSYDIYLIDVELNDESGIDFAEMLVAKSPMESKKIIFLSAHEKYALNALNRTNCFNYVLKPYSKKTLAGAISKCMALNKDHLPKESFIEFYLKGNKHLINKQSIMYVEIIKKKPYVNTTTGIIAMPRMTVALIIQMLNHPVFVQCRRGHVVNILHISQMKKDGEIYTLILNNGETIPVGDSFKQNVIDSITVSKQH